MSLFPKDNTKHIFSKITLVSKLHLLSHATKIANNMLAMHRKKDQKMNV